MRYRVLMLSAFLLLIGHDLVFAQQCWKKIKTIPLRTSAIDESAAGKVLVGNWGGEVLELDTLGAKGKLYSPAKKAIVDKVSRWSPYKVVAFYEAFQEVVILDRFLTETARYPLDQYNIGFASQVAFNFQQHLWVVDESDFSLKLLDLQLQKVLIEQPFFPYLDVDKHNITFLKEYQGTIFVVDADTGVLVFDNMGNHQKTIESSGVKDLFFSGDKMYMLKGEQLVIRSLYHQATDTVSLPKHDYHRIALSGGYFFFASDRQLDIYRYLREE